MTETTNSPTKPKLTEQTLQDALAYGTGIKTHLRAYVAECSRLASRVEELENSIRDAMSAAGGRWEEWGGRAMMVREILDKLLAGAHAEAGEI